jgi:hypothetical protein
MDIVDGPGKVVVMVAEVGLGNSIEENPNNCMDLVVNNSGHYGYTAHVSAHSTKNPHYIMNRIHYSINKIC